MEERWKNDAGRPPRLRMTRIFGSSANNSLHRISALPIIGRTSPPNGGGLHRQERGHLSGLRRTSPPNGGGLHLGLFKIAGYAVEHHPRMEGDCTRCDIRRSGAPVEHHPRMEGDCTPVSGSCARLRVEHHPRMEGDCTDLGGGTHEIGSNITPEWRGTAPRERPSTCPHRRTSPPNGGGLHPTCQTTFGRSRSNITPEWRGTAPLLRLRRSCLWSNITPEWRGTAPLLRLRRSCLWSNITPEWRGTAPVDFPDKDHFGSNITPEWRGTAPAIERPETSDCRTSPPNGGGLHQRQ